MELYISLIVVWLVIFVVSVIIEACTTELVSIWFSAGSIIALILSAIPNVPFYIPIIVFIVISLTLLLCLRPIIKKMLNKNTLNSNIDEIIGKKGIVESEINDVNLGTVKIHGVLWNALSLDKVPISKGSHVIVKNVNGNKLIVKEIKKEG